MVVSHRRNRMRSVLTLAFVLLLVAQLPPPTATAQTQVSTTPASPNPQLSVDKIAVIRQDGVVTHFLNPSTATVSVTIHNQAQTELKTVPVYLWFTELTDLAGKCVNVDVPGATPHTNGIGTDPGTVTKSITITVPSDPAPKIGYNITVLVNRDPGALAGKAFDPSGGGLSGCAKPDGSAPDARYGACPRDTSVTSMKCTPACAQNAQASDPTSNTDASASDPGTDCDATDNVASGYFVDNAQWDLGVAGVQQCVKVDDVAKCGADLACGMTPTASPSVRSLSCGDDAAGADFTTLMNSTRRPDDWPCDDATFAQSDRSSPGNQMGCPPKATLIPNYGDTAPALSYLAVSVMNHVEPWGSNAEGNATWKDDVDYSTCDVIVKTQNDANQRQTVRSIDRTTKNCGRIPYDVSIVVKGFGLPDAGLSLSPPPFAGFLGTKATQNSLEWNLTGMAGVYDVVVQLDPLHRLPVHAASESTGGYAENDRFHTDGIQVLDTDLRAALLDVSHTTIATAYDYSPSATISVPVTAQFFNDGLASPVEYLYQRNGQVQNGVATGTPATTVLRRPVNVSIWIGDTFTGATFYTEQNNTVGNVATMAPTDQRPAALQSQAYGPWVVKRIFTFSATPGAADFISPGVHTIHACIDCDPRHAVPDYYTGDNKTFERNESNNLAQADFYIKNENAPIVEPIMGVSTPYLTTGDQGDVAPLWKMPTQSKFHPHENMSIWANISDADQLRLNVEFNATLRDSNVTRTYKACASDAPQSTWADAGGCVYRAPSVKDTYVLFLRDFGRASNNTTETWDIRAIATNSFGKVTTSGATTFTLTRWPVQTMNFTKLLYGVVNVSESGTRGTPNFVDATFYPDNATFDYGANLNIVYRAHVQDDWTGIKNQENLSRNLGLKIEFPLNKSKSYDGTYWGSSYKCKEVPAGPPGVDAGGVRQDTAVQCPIEEKFNFSSLNLANIEDRLGPGIPGRWNVTIQITDLGGEVREINQTINIIDAPPILDQQTFSSTDVKPGDSVRVRVNASDDFEIADTYVNFSRVSDHYNTSFKLKLNGSAVPGFASPGVENNRLNYTYDDNVTTGRGKMLGVGGTYEAWFSAKDKFDNWGTTPKIKFVLNDTDRPNLLDAGVDQSLQEVGLPVTFHANGTDQTNITAYLTVLRADEKIVPRVAMNETSPGNYTYTTNFTGEGNFVWQIEIVDSVDQHSDLKSGPLSIRDNLGPRFEIRQPGNLVDGQLYGRAAPQISFLVYDADGVVKDSIKMMVNDAIVVPDDVVASTADGKGFIVNYTVTHKFAHRDVVRVNLTAVDASSKALEGYNNFTFVVDDVPPIVRLADFGPRFRGEDKNAWNVSLSTLFTLTADDNDGLPTTVDAIRYRIIGGGNNAAESVYSGPFRIGDAPGIYTGPRIYQIQFWAIDSVGNQNRTFESVTVYVDEIPPSLDPFGALPQGRFINATFIDDRSGVDRAVVWYSVNGGSFTPVALDFSGGLWSTILPEGKKGDKISYYLQAWDRVNNTDVFGNATVPYSTYVVGNHVPSIKITSPVEGSHIAHLVDLLWTAADEDGDPLTFLVYYRAPGKTNFVELVKLEVPDTRRYQLDTSRFQDGEYTFRVTAADGSFVALSDTKVTILNHGPAIGTVTPPPGQVAPGESILLKAEITKAQATVEARVYRDGNFVTSYPMNDEGKDGDVTANDGIYSVRVSFDQAGKYSVDILARYQEGGETKEDPLANAATFSVKLTPAGILQQYQALLVLAGLLAVVGVGVAAFVVLRRR